MLGSTIEEIADDTIIDMEAGIEHLSRSGGTLAHVDVLVLVFEASRKAVVTASRTIALARELGIPGWIGVANKIESSEEATVRALCAEHDVPLDVIIPQSDAIVEADHGGIPLSRNVASELWDTMSNLADRLAAVTSADSR
jgi:CO dehydrogenase maturation factor